MTEFQAIPTAPDGQRAVPSTPADTAAAPDTPTTPDWLWPVDHVAPSDEPYRTLVEDASDIIYAHDIDGRFLEVNRAGERLTGYRRDELLGMNIADVIAPEWLPVAREMMARKLAGEDRTLYEIAVVARDGRRVWLEVNTRLVRRGGQPVGVQGIARDISDRKQAEEALRESEERFRLLVENSNDGIWLLAADGIVFYASRPTTRILGYGLDEVVGRHVFDLVHPDDRERLSWVYATCLDKPGTALTAEFRYRHKDGRWLQLEAVMVGRLDDPGVGAIVVNYRDISERRRAEQALQESEERFRAVFESALVGVAHVDLDGRIVDVNRAVIEMSGLGRAELCGRSLADLAHPDDLAAGQRELTELVSGQRDSYRAERRFLGRNGRVFWADVSVSLVRDASGAASFCLAILQNVTERKQAEQELRESNRRLSVWVNELEQRTREIGLLSDMGDMLQACRTVDEAYDVVGPIAARLFPGSIGCVSATAAGGTLVETVARWGEACEPATFPADDCWALRRGRPHFVEDGTRGPMCRHLAGQPLAGALCVPMMAHGELLGVFTLGVHDGARLDEAWRRLAMTVAEHVALAFANLKLHETLRSQSIRDPLTGLFNRRYMEESLDREMRRARRGGHAVGIIMLDLDHFKVLNDSRGHEAGDELLKATAGLLQRSIRAEDIACRYGGEEFVLLLPEVSLDDAAHRAESIRQAARVLRVPFHRQVLGPLTVSAGVAVFPDHGPSGDALLRAADIALYQAKARGRDRVAVNRAGGLFGESIVDYHPDEP